MKKLMVLGAGWPQVNLLNAAKELGYATVVASIDGDYPGFQHADEISYTDISNPRDVLQAAKDCKIDGIATCCLDTGVKALGYTAETLGLCGLNAEAAEMCNNKMKMKEAFQKNGVSSAYFAEVTSQEDLVQFITDRGFPAIIKAVDLQGSKGIYIVRTMEEALSGFAETMKLTRENFCIVEEFIEGNEFGAQAFVYNGEIVFILPHGDNTYLSHTNVPVGHYAPIDLSEDMESQTMKVVTDAIRAIGLDNCAVNVDLIEKDGKVYIIELTGRAGATCLPELVSIYYGVDYYKMIALMAMGENPLQIFDKKAEVYTANASRMLLSEKSGIVKDIIVPDIEGDDRIFDFSLIIKPGDQVNKFENAKDRVGQLIVKAPTYPECERIIREIFDKFEIIFE